MKTNITDTQAKDLIEWLKSGRKQSVWCVDEIEILHDNFTQCVHDIENEMAVQNIGVRRG